MTPSNHSAPLSPAACATRAATKPAGKARRWLILACLAWSWSAVPTVHAQTKPNPAQLSEAQNHYKLASAFQDLRQYDKAVEEYLKAYSLYPHAEFLFNIAEVYRLGKQFRNALDYYQRYLQMDPRGRGSVASRARITEIRKMLAATRISDQAKADKAKADKAKADKAKADKAKADKAKADEAGASDTKPQLVPATPSTTLSSKPSVPGATRSAASAKRPGRTLRIAGLSSAAVGVVALGLGVKFGLDAADLQSQFETGGTWNPDLYDRGQSKNRNMYIMYGVGTVALAAGGVLYMLGHKAGKEQRPSGRLTVSPVVGAAMTGMVLGGSY